MRFDVSQSLNGDKVIYIARDTGGIVRLRKETLEEIRDAIKEYNEQLTKEADVGAKARGKGKGVSAKVKVEDKRKDNEVEEAQEELSVETPVEVQSALPPESQPSEEGGATDKPKKFLQSELKDTIEEKRKKSGKKNFWDRLK